MRAKPKVIQGQGGSDGAPNEGDTEKDNGHNEGAHPLQTQTIPHRNVPLNKDWVRLYPLSELRGERQQERRQLIASPIQEGVEMGADEEGSQRMKRNVVMVAVETRTSSE